jgi:hypothetical protein
MGTRALDMAASYLALPSWVSPMLSIECAGPLARSFTPANPYHQRSNTRHTLERLSTLSMLPLHLTLIVFMDVDKQSARSVVINPYH